jgi:ornithine carbamoyltransferase
MQTNSLRGRDFIAETDFSKEEIETILDVAADLKLDWAKGVLHDDLLRSKTLFMIFLQPILTYTQLLRSGNDPIGRPCSFS